MGLETMEDILEKLIEKKSSLCRAINDVYSFLGYSANSGSIRTID